ncbi:hypothetical protein LSG31_21890 [Fodinisporobacter ferrooxydans]|uniref:Ketosynthase family 3 (KS3) domain-containing protein n=1 Tax=Fodinisporobacter ferrooxydans TaxID=2901836 RepID=A0ABY4CJG8_9BACL|nr:hypothetical protein LSG31_21890 [Alicyclobacillaceae bacterium MYW30-H2]
MDRVVITGYGIKAPGIRNPDQFKEVLETGTCTQEILKGMGPYDSDIVCGVIHDDFQVIDGKNYRKNPRNNRLAIAATVDAMEMARVPKNNEARMAILLGTGAGSLYETEKLANISTNGDFRKFPVYGAGLTNTHSLASGVAAHFGCSGMVYTVSSGCTSTLDVVLLGKLLLETNQADICIVGGADAAICKTCIFSFAKLGTIALDKGVDETGIPFGPGNDFVISEGAGILIMERENDAIRRGADIYSVIDAICSNNDAISINQSDPTGTKMLEALKGAVGDTKPSYVNSQALGLIANDSADSFAHRSLFGNSVPITSIKGNIGQPLAAAGSIQVISALVSMQYGFIPPTIKTSLEYYDLPIVLEPVYCNVSSVAITSHGYGGNNTCIRISKYESINDFTCIDIRRS